MRHAYVGQVCWTALSAPGGLVQLLDITHDAVYGPCAQVQHLLDHPYGYAQGTLGWYPLRDLQPCGWPEADDAPVQGDPPGAPHDCTVTPQGGRRCVPPHGGR